MCRSLLDLGNPILIVGVCISGSSSRCPPYPGSPRLPPSVPSAGHQLPHLRPVRTAAEHRGPAGLPLADPHRQGKTHKAYYKPPISDFSHRGLFFVNITGKRICFSNWSATTSSGNQRQALLKTRDNSMFTLRKTFIRRIIHGPTKVFFLKKGFSVL